MRIIAGSAKGRRLHTPQGDNTRPTLDRVREALFNILMPYTLEARVLDLFAGSGALALEALSRGARYAAIVDTDRESIRVIRQNIQELGFGDAAQVLDMPALKAIEALRNQGQLFDLVFLDPPYGLGWVEKALSSLIENKLLLPEAIIVAETALQEKIEIPKGLVEQSRRKYGKVALTFLRLE